MKGLTRPCADFAESKDVDAEGHCQVGIELALKPTLIRNITNALRSVAAGDCAQLFAPLV